MEVQVLFYILARATHATSFIYDGHSSGQITAIITKQFDKKKISVLKIVFIPKIFSKIYTLL